MDRGPPKEGTTLPRRDRTDADFAQRRRQASAEGAEIVRATFDAAITRRRLAELVGISTTTVRRWEVAGVIQPRTEVILGSPTKVFDRAEIAFGRRLIAILRERRGTISLEEAATEARARNPRS